jgi:hypothetical protein
MSQDDMSKTLADWEIDEPLETIKCTDTHCEKDKHSHLKIRPRNESYRNIECNDCGVNDIDWPRLDKRNPDDLTYTVRALNREYVRYRYWNATIDEEAISRARRKGLDGLREWIPRRLDREVARPSKELFRDGTQTPKTGNIVFYAQHATACCCRKCIEEWHGIDRNEPLSRENLNYFNDMILHYVENRLPALKGNGI